MNHIQSTKLSYILTIPAIADEGFLSFAEEGKHIAFPMKRLYYIYDVEQGAKRGHHAHKKTKQMLFCIKGSITIILDNGEEREIVQLDKPNQGIFLDAMMWHEMEDFTKDTILLVIASDIYEESDYIRDYNTFLSLAGQPNTNQTSRWIQIPNSIFRVVSRTVSLSFASEPESKSTDIDQKPI